MLFNPFTLGVEVIAVHTASFCVWPVHTIDQFRLSVLVNLHQKASIHSWWRKVVETFFATKLPSRYTWNHQWRFVLLWQENLTVVSTASIHHESVYEADRCFTLRCLCGWVFSCVFQYNSCVQLCTLCSEAVWFMMGPHSCATEFAVVILPCHCMKYSHRL